MNRGFALNSWKGGESKGSLTIPSLTMEANWSVQLIANLSYINLFRMISYGTRDGFPRSMMTWDAWMHCDRDIIEKTESKASLNFCTLITDKGLEGNRLNGKDSQNLGPGSAIDWNSGRLFFKFCVYSGGGGGGWGDCITPLNHFPKTNPDLPIALKRYPSMCDSPIKKHRIFKWNHW